MADLMKAKENLEARGYAVRLFPDKESAAKYLNEVIDGTSVGFGGSMTLDQMGLFPSLGQHNTVFWHWKQNPADARASAANAAVYLSSVNALAETGEIVNIDGTGNRVASMIFGPKNVALIIGKNKFAETMDECMDRIKAVACARNAQRLGLSTPCAVAGRCTDCFSKERICSVTTIIEAKPGAISEMHLILVDEVLGY